MSSLIKNVALCAAVLFACGTTAYAADAAPPAAAAAHQWGHGHEQGRHHGGIWQALEPIHSQLNLSPAQEQQWQAAVAAVKANHEQQRAAFKQTHEQMKALLQAPVLDLRAISALHKQAGEQMHQAREQAQENFLKFYDTLNPTQKGLVSAVLKTEWRKMGQRWHHGEGKPGEWKNGAPAAQAQ